MIKNFFAKLCFLIKCSSGKVIRVFQLLHFFQLTFLKRLNISNSYANNSKIIFYASPDPLEISGRLR